MIRKNKRLIRLFITFSFLFLVLVVLISNAYNNNIYKVNQNNYVNNQTTNVKKAINNALINDYKLVSDNLIDNNDINSFYLYGGSQIDEIISINDNLLNYNDSSYLINNDLYKNNYAFFKLNDILKDDVNIDLFNKYLISFYVEDLNLIAVLDARSYLNNFTLDYNIENFIIMDNSGYFYYSNKNLGSITNLTNYLKGNDDILLIENINSNEVNSIKSVVNNKDFLISFIKFDNDQNLLMIFDESYIFSMTNSNLYFFIVAALIIYIVLIVSFLVSISFIYKKYNDLELTRLKTFYNKRPIIYISTNGKIKSFNKTFKEKFKTHYEIKSLNQLFNYADEELKLLIRRQEALEGVLEVDGELVITTFIPLKARYGYVLVALTGITTNESMEYQNIALYNEVTNLPNLESFLKYMEGVLENPDLSEYTILGSNIIDFKNVNNLIGESQADELVKDIASYIKETVPFKDVKIFNTKIDNFVIVFKGLKSMDAIIKWANETVNLYRQRNTNKNILAIDLKFGILNLENEHKSLEVNEIYVKLYQAVELAKTLINEAVIVYDQTTESYYKNLRSMEEDIIKAIENDEFIIYLQPQFNNETNKIVGFESLIRWDNPKYQYESIEKVIKVAEDNNLIVDIGRITIKKSLEIAKKLEKENVVISINVSPIQILQIGFVEEFLNLVEKYKVRKDMIAIEITETVLMSSFNIINEKIKQLKNRGIHIHLDDFGTGYSSLKYLEQLSVDTIKIDREFMIGYPQDKFKRETVKFITNLAKSLDLDVIVEGVETEEQSKHLKRNNANIIQGFLISKAVPLNEAFTLIRKYNYDKELET